MTDFDEIRQRMDLLSDDELLSVIREQDENQWRPEVFDIVRVILHGRGVSVDENAGEVSGIEAPEEPPALGLATVASYSTSMDAEMDRLALVSKGIEAWVVGIGLSMESPSGIALKVREADLRAAVELLDPGILDQPVASTDLPEEIAEPPCPKCGSRNVMESAEKVYDPPGHEWLYHCASCGHKWSEI